MEAHHNAVAIILENVKSFHDRGVQFRIYHGSTNSTRHLKFDPEKVIDTSSLSHVITIDKVKNIAVVEPNVAMDVLVRETLNEGLVPAVVPEFPGITVGGSYSGTAAESSSFRYGYFDRIVNWVEIVLPNGIMVTASRNQNADLFHGAAGALGTFGVTTLFEIQLIPTSPLVEITYTPVYSIADALATLEKSQEDVTIRYLDAIIFSAYSGVVVTGRHQPPAVSDQAPSSRSTFPVVQFSRSKNPWFCLHVHQKINHPCNTHCIVCRWNQKLPDPFDPNAKKPAMVELVPIYDYFFRYDRGAFWMGCYGWEEAAVPFNRFSRWALDRAFRTRAMYKMMHHVGKPPVFIIQDLAIPEEKAQEFLEFVGQDLKIYPLWLCPILGGSKVLLHTAKEYTPPSKTHDSLKQAPASIMNIGLWGVPNLGSKRYDAKNYQEFIDANRDIERKVRNLKGLKWLYAHNYSTEEEFWQAYDKQIYDEMRNKWHADGLPSIWDKVKRETEDRPRELGLASAVRAMFAIVFGKDYILEKKKKEEMQ